MNLIQIIRPAYYVANEPKLRDELTIQWNKHINQDLDYRVRDRARIKYNLLFKKYIDRYQTDPRIDTNARGKR